MQIVIDIPEETYEYWKEHCHEYVLSEAIKNGVPLPEDYRQMAEELKRHREAWNKLKNDVVAYHNNYDYDTAMHFLNIIDIRLSEIRSDAE